MKKTQTILDKEVRAKVKEGVNAIFAPLKLTLGPESGSALLYGTYGRGPRIIDDGAIIGGSMTQKDEQVELAARAFREATEKTNQRAGDGTTTTTVIGGVLINQILNKIDEISDSYASAKIGVRKTKKYLLGISKKISELITARAKKVETLEELEKIAIVSLNNEDLGKIVAKMAWDVGVDGKIDVVEGFKGEIETEIVEGAKFAAKPAANRFMNNATKFEMIATDCPVLLTNYSLNSDAQMRAIFVGILAKNPNLVVIAPDFSDRVLISMVKTLEQGVNIFPVRVPSLRSEQFEDLAVFFGANFIDKKSGKKLENITEEDLGFVERLIVKGVENKEDAVAVGGKGEREGKMKVANQEYATSSPVAERIKMLKGQLEEERTDINKKILESRIASLVSKIGVIRVGSTTTAENLDVKSKIEDCKYACRSALQEGYVKGGGLCLKEIAEELEKTETNEIFKFVSKALKAPYEQIQTNAEEKLEIGEEIIDPAKVVRLAAEHALSVSAGLITCKIIVSEQEEVQPGDAVLELSNEVRNVNRLFQKKFGIELENQEEIDKDNARVINDYETQDGE